jgi:hypothetical protein
MDICPTTLTSMLICIPAMTGTYFLDRRVGDDHKFTQLRTEGRRREPQRFLQCRPVRRTDFAFGINQFGGVAPIQFDLQRLQRILGFEIPERRN